jgi:hypothetical protein
MTERQDWENIVPGAPIGSAGDTPPPIHFKRDGRMWVGGVETTIEEFRNLHGLGQTALPGKHLSIVSVAA